MDAAQRAATRMADSLTITMSAYNDFLEDQERFSDPYKERTVME